MESKSIQSTIADIEGMIRNLNAIRDMIETVEAGTWIESNDNISIANETIGRFYSDVKKLRTKCRYIKRCKRCNKIFLTGNNNVAYCDRIDESGLSCSDVGSKESFQKKMASDEALLIYNRAYKTHHARIRAGTMTREQLNVWKNAARSRLAQCRSGRITIQQLQMWLSI